MTEYIVREERAPLIVESRLLLEADCEGSIVFLGDADTFLDDLLRKHFLPRFAGSEIKEDEVRLIVPRVRITVEQLED